MNAAEWKSEIADLETRLRYAKDQLHQAIISESPVKVGMIFTREIKRGYGSKAKTVVQRGQVTGFSRNWGITHAVITLFNADGSLGKRATEYGWGWEAEK